MEEKDMELMEEQIAETPEEIRDIPEQAEAVQEYEEHHEHHAHHHDDEHHEHHHHHSGKHKHSHKRRRKKWKFYEKNKKILRPLFAVLLIVVIAMAVVAIADIITKNRTIQDTPSQTAGLDGVVVLAVPVFDQPQSLVTAGVQAIMDNQNMAEPAHVIVEKHWSETKRLDVSVPVQLTFRVMNKPADYAVSEYRVTVATDDAYTDGVEHIMRADEQALNLQNLLPGTAYYYKIVVYFTNGVHTSVEGSFVTEQTPRVLSVEGVYNVRDMGGWKTTDGKSIRHGLLIRGTELDGAVESEYRITEAGTKVLLEDFGVKMDMDLRWDDQSVENTDPLGYRVTHIYYDSPLYTDVFVEKNKENVRKIFADLAKPEHYPIYMHCTYGIDRTGTICALLQAVLGVQEEDIYREYQLSALSRKYLTDIAFGNFMVSLKELPGDTLQEKAEHYLISIGVTAAEIEQLRQIYLN